ncbi:site-specific integrase [Weizmannia coagulans]|uniref:E integrase family site specific recombinase n=2 Tax=Heyndrickxia TaxID=2837504 RepID=A0AAN0T4R1_HEYCO|nr:MULTISPECIES: site-specific integrase [Heyndrickxia]AJO22872.1 e integrase family site specific recombinase [Heyndrickxia coagulans]AKN55616.1 Phage integrase: site-specific recombinase [Heyndrickxia coagulans]ATW83112.1 site-specific integrase [Heyndrickxia coagulans]AVD56224.1 site-specific integrase [Heyndrickxia coagulans]KGB28319.1 integrase [Heyndrickxia coagulans]
MNVVQPIRDPVKIEKMKNYLKSKSERNYILFMLGISVGLRISDILKLKKEDILRSHIDIKETKTKKNKRVKIPGYIKKEIIPYAKTLADGDYLIKSRQGANRPIDRSTAYRILRDAAKHVGLTDIGTHTLRKTFGYHFYMQTKNVALLQELLNHSRPDITLRYIGINQDTLDKAMDKFRI